MINIENDKTIEWYKDAFITANRERNELQSKVNAYDLFLRNTVQVDMNANDFFEYACAHSVSIDESDFDWILTHIQKWGQSGMDAVIAYVFNQIPIKPVVNEKFEKALSELTQRDQKVFGDIDWQSHYYNIDGPYRKINKK